MLTHNLSQGSVFERIRNGAKFIVFEGIDGCGKTTQINLLSQRLSRKNIANYTTREPSDKNPVGKLTREAVHNKYKLENETLALLFAADRYEHIKQEVLPALNRGEYVLCDRYYYSNFAYQGGDSFMTKNISLYNRCIMENFKPDLTVFIDVKPEECLRRIKENRFEADGIYEDINILNAVRSRYLTTFEQLKNTDNIYFIDGNGLSETETAEMIAKTINL